jgi:deoxyribodipyrimidine photo-lyase
MSTALVWLRRDLRVRDHPALRAAHDAADTVVPVFCFDDRLLHGRNASGPRTQFLLECLADLDESLKERGSALVIRHGTPERELPRLAGELDAASVHFSADVGPFARARDECVAEALGEAGADVHAHPGLFVVDELDELRTAGGDPFTVFTPFHRAWMRVGRRPVHQAPRKLGPMPGVDRGSIPRLGELGLTQEVADPASGGEGPGRTTMKRFLDGTAGDYENGRNALGDERVSRLSPYLHFGCISPRELEERLPPGQGGEGFRRQLCWRDFYAQVLLGFPGNAHHEHQRKIRGNIRWSHAEKQFQAWCEGRTGYPAVDAGMRQLRREGWIHNRGRLIVGSFLTKDLGIDWRRGERWFMRHLIDGDEASNNGNWQWIASVGVDPQPVSRRLFNPTRQQQRFDADGSYVRRYVPELRDVPDEYLAEPWTMPPEVQREAGCVIGTQYPEPIVEHAVARREALARYGAARDG